MRCQIVRQKLEAYAVEEITPQVRAGIEGHLRSCSGCRDVLARQTELEALVRNLPAPPVPDGFADRLMARARVCGDLPRRGSPSRWKALGWLGPGRLWQKTGSAAALAAGLAAGLLIGGLMGGQTWQHSALRIGTGNRVLEADLVGASGLGSLAGLGDTSLGGTYLGMTWAPDDEGV